MGTGNGPEPEDGGIPPIPPPPDAASRQGIERAVPRPDPRDAEWADFPSPSWGGLEAIPVFLLALVATAVLAAPFVILVDACSDRFVLGALVGDAALAGMTLVWIRYVSRGALGALGPPRRPLRDLGAGLATGAVLVVIAAVVATVMVTVATSLLGHAPPEADQVDACVRGSALALLGPVVILGAPAAEEIFFRGFLFRGLRRRFRFWPAALISGAAFGAVHIIPVTARQAAGTALIAPALFVVGVGLAFVYERRKSLLAPMAAHAVFNVVGFLSIALART
jgi:membrane protease YdiL (CAAX protease family)